MTNQTQADDFDIGKAIFDLLKDVPGDRQERVLRWVAEGLGVATNPFHNAPAPVTASLASSTAPISTASILPTAQHQVAGHSTDIKSFISAKAPKSDAQYAAAVSYYYRFEAPPAQRRDSITAELLQESTRLAGRARFSNPLNTLNNAKKAGFLDGAARGEFSVNSVGENLVAMTLPGDGSAPVRSLKPKTKKVAKKRVAKKKARAK